MLALSLEILLNFRLAAGELALYSVLISNAHHLAGKRSRDFVLLTTLSLLMTVICAPKAVQAAEVNQSSAVIESDIAIRNFSKVSSTLWRGSLPSDKGLDQLAQSGIKTIIDLRYSGSGCKHEASSAAKLGMNYFHLPIGFNKISLNEITSFLNIVGDPKNGPVFVHCRQGADRTGSLVGIYRILVQNWSFEKTYREMRSFHFKPWLFTMKKSVANIADNETTKQAMKLAFVEKPTISEMP